MMTRRWYVSARDSDSEGLSTRVLLSIAVCVALPVQPMYASRVIDVDTEYSEALEAWITAYVHALERDCTPQIQRMLPSISGSLDVICTECSTRVIAVFIGCTRLSCIALLVLLSSCA